MSVAAKPPMPNVLFALWAVMLQWSPQRSLLLMVTPKYFCVVSVEICSEPRLYV